jgi:hypothetical protein
MVMMPSKNWQPGHAADEKGLFPFHYDDLWVKLGLWRWRKPAWAKAPEYKNWLKLPREEIDEFGVIWLREGKNESLGHPGRSVLNDWAELDKFLARYCPDPYDKSRYTDFIRLSKLVGRNRYRMCILGAQGPYTMASAIRGFNAHLEDHHESHEELKKLLSHLTAYYVGCMHAWVRYGAKPHGFMLYDDLGDQTRPFLNPKTFESFYRPVYKTLIDTAHELGCDFHLHSCGKIDKLIPIFIDWGLDAFEFDAPRMIGYKDLAPFCGKIMMWGDVDIQKIYASGTPEECEQEVAIMIEKMGTNDGGFGAYFYPQTYHINVPKANIRAFARGLKKYGTYKR